ncbi:ribosome small subunit-dependent GTPase A [Defluviitalea phaphyphila]|uniref:ribosome small subunit-dependent GTPase A n=1 Tax=Defluviitalea phaphyphila TaxID=1473580 RepID=UPI00072FB1E8|nr:ribosome small subunit-dependent GTPase A [Defluviitalea phaphyphila]
MVKGIITKGIAGFYYVKVEDKVFECKARGKFRNSNITPVVGDIVKIIPEESNLTGSIVEILPRKNILTRPSVANVDQAIIVFAAKNPDPNLQLLDRFLVLVEEQNLEICICINKIDIDKEKTYQEIKNTYEKIGYKVILTSAILNIGIDKLKNELFNKVTTFAGPSGVGKSSLLNAIDSSLSLKTGEISKKVKRGKHTTRHVELLNLKEESFVLDTPGFSMLSLEHINPKELKNLFKEFLPYNDLCRFSQCSHIHEPDCIIKQKVEEGVIDAGRYKRYQMFYKELETSKQRRW